MADDDTPEMLTHATAGGVALRVHDAASLTRWLVEQALPVWAGTAVDLHRGGFFEKLDLDGRPVEEARRARVVARQIYVFATAARRGWLAGADALVGHGLHFLFSRMQLPGGTFAAAVAPDGRVERGGFDLYEHAFVLFALAAARQGRPDREPLRAEAEALLQRLRSRWGHPHAGFEEAAPRTLPLKSNPHMHLLEAALAWAELSDGPEARVWDALADELVALCRTRFISPDSGALREYFDGDWRALPAAAPAAAGAVEPGHQFEWAWLLMRWSRRHGQADALEAANRLLDIGELHGVDPALGVAVNTLDEALRVTDGASRLWPQTERIKAWHLKATIDGVAGRAAFDRRDAAIRGLARYLLVKPAGIWNEQFGADGTVLAQHCRASSLYHIVCAVDTVQDAGRPQSAGMQEGG